MADYRYIQDRRTGVKHRLLGVVDNTLTEEGIAADAKVVGDALATKAENDGSYDSMTVGNAEQLISSVYEEDSVPYQFRTSGGSIDIGDREEDKIIGGTVAWNQLAYSYNITGATQVVSDDVVTITPSIAGHRYIMTRESNSSGILVVNGHVYLQSVVIKSDGEHGVGFQNYANPGSLNGTKKTNSASWTNLCEIAKCTQSGVCYAQLASLSVTEYAIKKDSFVLYDLTQMFGSTIADYIYTLEQTTAGAGVAWFRKLFPKPYYPYNPGELLSVSDLQSHDMVGFNQWDEEWENGSYNADGEAIVDATRIRTKNPIRVVGGATYYFKSKTTLGIRFYDGNDKYIPSGYITTQKNTTAVAPSNASYLRFSVVDQATYNHDICINLSWDGERDGEYEPYKKWSYPLDDSLTLRGIPKLDADNKLYYDGDVYESDGTVTRKYGVVDLGTLNWSKYNPEGTNVPVFYSSADIPNMKPSSGNNAICNRYTCQSWTSLTGRIDKSVEIHPTVARPYIADSAYSDAASFKTAMSGVYLVYELDTPTTESADPYQNPQIVDDFGTEEYVTTSIVPVGHETKYQPNLRAKLEMAPNSPDGNGDYIVRHTNGENVYVPLAFPADELPPAPTENGTYRLTVTVSNGTATYAWVSA